MTATAERPTRPPEPPRPAAAHVPLRPSFPQVVQRLFLVLLLTGAMCTSWSIGQALIRPGNDSVSSRVAEWARDHYLNSLVTLLERAKYSADAPAQGGTPLGGIPSAASDGGGDTADRAPAPVPVLADGPPLPNEGQWQVVVHNHGRPAVRLTYVRPDNRHTSYLAAVMWLDPQQLSARLLPGTQDPGGHWATPDHLDAVLQKTVAAAFPGGFRLNGASRGGYFDAGRTARPLRIGAASAVIRTDGTLQIGEWGRDVTMGPDVRSVRQNLDLLVDHGQVASNCADDNAPVWGKTVGNRSFVPRTAAGQRPDGTLVVVNSPATSVCSLGAILQAAGAVQGMELDINPYWAIAYYYTHASSHAAGAGVTGHKVRPDQTQGEQHYYAPQSRDFFALFLRP